MSMSYYEITLIFPAHSSIDWWDLWCHHIYYWHPFRFKANSKYMFETNYLVPSAWVYYSRHSVWGPNYWSKMISVFSSSVTWSYTICFESCRFAYYIEHQIQSRHYLFLDGVHQPSLFRRVLCLSDGCHFPVTCSLI